MRTIKRTKKHGVQTTRGFVFNLEHPTGKFDMPVKVIAYPGKTNGKPRPPLVLNDSLIFALPDNGNYVSSLTLDDL